MSHALTTAQKFRAYRSIEQFGIENLKLLECEPEAIAYGKVRVKLRAASLNFRDLMVAKGQYNPKWKTPLGIIPLSDGAGEVIEIGEGVRRFKVGDKVVAAFMPEWIAGDVDEEKAKSSLGGAVDGVLTTARLFDQEGLLPIPDHLNFEEAATLPCAALTAWNALFVSDRLKHGETVLLLGTGGVSIFALQFAKMAGATVIITSSSDEKLERAKKLGADHLINYKNQPDWEKKVLELTGGRGVDHVVELGGNGTLAKSIRAVRIGGHIALIGVLAGGEGTDTRPLLMKNIRLHGIFVGSRQMFEQMNKAIVAAKLHPIIDCTFAFEDSLKAFSYLESGSHFGKVVIKMA
jgi:NADPH:quinone reductase-like Zn-dependent oxidoreductase